MKNIKVIEKIGRKPGKTLVILAGIHGNEICGVKAFDKLLPNLEIDSGKVYFIYANLKAIEENKRFVDKDMNRCFFINQSKEIAVTLEGKTAKEIIPYLECADLMLDIHASFTKDSIPFVICDEKWIEDAKIFESNIITFNWDAFEPGSTDYFMNLQKKPGFCFECGYLNDQSTYLKAERAIIQFLKYSKCISGDVSKTESQEILKIKSIYKNKEGIFKKARDFPDFYTLKKKMLIGREGKKEVYADKGEILLFVREVTSLNEECFLIAEKIENQKLNKTQDSTSFEGTKKCKLK